MSDENVETSETPDEETYAALKNAEWWIVFSPMNNFAFRFGPYTDGRKVGEILTRAMKYNIGLTVIANCGPEIDWKMIEDQGPYKEKP